MDLLRRSIERFGLRFVASPRHADVLMVTGPVTKNMREALERTYHATPNPKWVVAVGDCARNGGCFAGSYAVVGGVPAALNLIGGRGGAPGEIFRENGIAHEIQGFLASDGASFVTGQTISASGGYTMM